MDIYCPRCGEPWDVFSLTDDMTPEKARNLKAGKGCPCCCGKEVCLRKETCDVCPLYQLDGLFYIGQCRAGAFKKPFRAEASEALMGILGDDLDGVAAMLEDFNL
jgi:hypothetical protein